MTDGLKFSYTNSNKTVFVHTLINVRKYFGIIYQMYKHIINSSIIIYHLFHKAGKPLSLLKFGTNFEIQLLLFGSKGLWLPKVCGNAKDCDNSNLYLYIFNNNSSIISLHFPFFYRQGNPSVTQLRASSSDKEQRFGSC